MKRFSEQTLYFLGGIVIFPLIPFLYWQGWRTRKKVGRLPDAGGETCGQFGERGGEGEPALNLLAIGESTVAGVGAESHAEALAGQLARFLSLQTNGRMIRWHVLGESGITARETLQKLIPLAPDTEMDLVVIALGGNDTFKVNSPNRYVRDMSQLIEKLKRKYPKAKILLANTPMIIDFPALPEPLKTVLWRVSRLHHEALRGAAAKMENVFYFDEAERVGEDFFSDGVHPSPYGYALWSEAMIKFLLRKTDFESK